jgi:hypothetical protein
MSQRTGLKTVEEAPMSTNVAHPEGRIFISYRREETAYPAGWLYDRLRVRYAGQVFKDVDNIEPGDDFVAAITRAVAACDVLLALIGDRWLTITGADGSRRIDDPEDFVRVEIQAALTRNVRVIPILIDGVEMPRAEDLPSSLAMLVRRQALDLSHSRFDFDMGRLLRVLDATLLEAREPPGSATTVMEGGGGNAPDTAAAAAADPPVHRRSRRIWTALAIGGAAVLAAVLITAVQLHSENTSRSSAGIGTQALSEDFTSRVNGWSNISRWSTNKDGYANGAYRISVSADRGGGTAAWGFPQKSAIFPEAPPNIRVEVDAHRLPDTGEGTEFGLLCRSLRGGDGYIFAVAEDHAEIMRVSTSGYQMLSERRTPINAATTNRVRAECITVNGQQGVRLVLSVNNHEVVTVTDTDDPLLSGTIGLHVGSPDGATKAAAAEFDNVAVTQL